MAGFLVTATALAFGFLGSGIVTDRDLEVQLSRPIIGPHRTMEQVQCYVESHVLPMPVFRKVFEWEQYAKEIRKGVLERVIFRGEATTWRDAETCVQWLGTISGGPGYHIRKLRYEALPGLWVPALLYEPNELTGHVPVILNVNGHDRDGKAAPYKQIRCINQAKRGMLALNVEWLGMGQLGTHNFGHYRMNQLDLCGTSGLAVHYLYLKRAIDLLVSLEHADLSRFAVTGLSGGGWQTIFISAFDTRVKLANPVAGYSSYFTRVRNLSDLGDSEQTPTDLAVVTDYAHMTALMAPRPILLTYNAKDECCFRADHALEPLVSSAVPIYRLYGKQHRFRSHVNDDPGTHNYQLDNRQQFYRMLGDFFHEGNVDFEPQEIPSDDEVKTKDMLHVELPVDNTDFNRLAMGLSRELPRKAKLPEHRRTAVEWQCVAREKLGEIVESKQYLVASEELDEEMREGIRTTWWKLHMNHIWTVPAVEFEGDQSTSTIILVADRGRTTVGTAANRLLKRGKRVVTVDPFYLGESKIEKKDFLFALLISAIGDRPLGLQASQIAAIARWLCDQRGVGPVRIVAIGPRSSLFSLIASALEPKAISGLDLHESFGSLKEIIEQNTSVDEAPELFCFGLLEQFDIKQLTALVAPRPANFVTPSDRAKTELHGLRSWYNLLGADVDPTGGG